MIETTEEKALALPPENTPAHLDSLLSQIERLLHGSITTKTREQLASLLPLAWRRAADVWKYAALQIGRLVDYYCRLQLWEVAGYASFKEAWEAEGAPDIAYSTVMGWRYADQCRRMAGLNDMQAALSPIGKLIAAKSILQQAIETGDDARVVEEMVRDLADPDITREQWLERHRPASASLPPPRDRAVIDSATGKITCWRNTRNPPVGISLGQADLRTEEARWAWQEIIEGKLPLEWG